jgi:hypothetical protein
MRPANIMAKPPSDCSGKIYVGAAKLTGEMYVAYSLNALQRANYRILNEIRRLLGRLS